MGEELTASQTPVAESANVDLSGVLDALSALHLDVDVIGSSFLQASEDVNTYLAGLVTLQLFTLLALLVLVGAMLALVFVVAVRKL